MYDVIILLKNYERTFEKEVNEFRKTTEIINKQKIQQMHKKFNEFRRIYYHRQCKK